MKNKYTLKELVDIGLNAACQFEPNSSFPLSFQNYQEAFTKAIYEFLKDKDREAFDAWWATNDLHFQRFSNAEDAFKAWKAGREELRKAMPMFSFDKNITITTEPEWWEPEWISWNGGSNPIVGEQTRFEIKLRNGERFTCAENDLHWSHNGSIGDIVAYRILD
jgi:hypothetical protein